MRGLFTGVARIVRFNWHFYVIGAIATLIGAALIPIVPGTLKLFCIAVWSVGILTTLVSLVVSWYIYDLSGFYRFQWIPMALDPKPERIVNIHAGFDETSDLLKQHFPRSQVEILDFYDPAKHTEISIRRARKAYPPSSETVSV